MKLTTRGKIAFVGVIVWGVAFVMMVLAPPPDPTEIDIVYDYTCADGAYLAEASCAEDVEEAPAP